MIRRVTVRNFKRFREQTFDLADSVVLAGPNNAGKSTLLHAIAVWKLGLERWGARRAGGRAAARSGVAVTRAEISAVPLREMNLLWEDRKVSGSRGMAGARRLIEIVVEGRTNGEDWSCGIELQYANPELAHVRPVGARALEPAAFETFPPEGARALDIVHVPPLSGIERDEPRRDRGMQDLLVGLGRPGDILRNLLLEVSENDKAAWNELAAHLRGLFRIELQKPSYSAAQPYILCEYKELGLTRALDLSNAGSGMRQTILLLAFLYARPAAVILLDEPDAHQHIILQRQVYDLLRKIARERGGQIIVATHSEVVLDSTEPSRVLGFFGQAPRPLADETARDRLREALKRVTTTDLLLGRELGSILYVEGESDERILAEWARILDHAARRFFDRPFVHRLGSRSLRGAEAHFFALRAAFPDMRAVCLLDGDNRDEPDAETARSGMTVLRWRRYEIENYLLQPEAIRRFANFPLADRRVEEAFARQIPPGTDLFGDHVALVRVKASDEFLLPLLRTLGAPAPKRDLYQLAARMTADEIHPEAREKLRRIAKALDPGAKA